MEKLTLQGLEAQTDEINQLLCGRADLDTFCSSTHWILPAHRAFASFRPLWIRMSDAGYVILARSYHPVYGLYLEPLEAIWGLACPFVPRDPDALARDFAQELLTERRNRSSLVLSGLRADSPLFAALRTQLSHRMRLGLGPTARRYRASLEGGVDGFLRRRTPKFRTNLRRSERMAHADGITFELHRRFASWSDVAALYERVVAIERRSWKGLSGSGLVEPAMRDFYRYMLAGIWQNDAVRAVIARQRDEDVGFVFGAVFHNSYRGLQMSFDDRLRRLSLGNLLQWEMIRLLCDEGWHGYDMGVEVPYKEHWAEEVWETVALLATWATAH